MIAIVSLLLVLVVSMIITRVASLALTHTGLSRQSATFQARSAFTGVGFTTSESEKVVNHPVRRRILLLLMVVGNAGVVTAIATLLIGFLQVNGGTPMWMRAAVLAGGLAALLALAMSKRMDHFLSRAVLWALRRFTSLNVRDYAALLHLSGEYAIGEIYVQKDDWMASRSLRSLKMASEGVVVLSVTRADGTFVGAPKPETKLRPGDMLVVYGRTPRIQALDERRRGMGGELAHVEAVADEKIKARDEEIEENQAAERDAGEKAS
jgi:hypothetical protein